MVSEPGDGTGPSGPDEEIGSVAEEAAKLFGALSEWARDHGPDLGQGLSGLASHAGLDGPGGQRAHRDR